LLQLSQRKPSANSAFCDTTYIIENDGWRIMAQVSQLPVPWKDAINEEMFLVHERRLTIPL